jgi:hypothetical protein
MPRPGAYRALDSARIVGYNTDNTCPYYNQAPIQGGQRSLEAYAETIVSSMGAQTAPPTPTGCCMAAIKSRRAVAARLAYKVCPLSLYVPLSGALSSSDSPGPRLYSRARWRRGEGRDARWLLSACKHPAVENRARGRGAPGTCPRESSLPLRPISRGAGSAGVFPERKETVYAYAIV